MMHRFYTSCDHDGCQERSAEYTAFPSCVECLLQTCPAHTQPGSEQDADVETPARVTCVACTAEAQP